MPFDGFNEKYVENIVLHPKYLKPVMMLTEKDTISWAYSRAYRKHLI